VTGALRGVTPGEVTGAERAPPRFALDHVMSSVAWHRYREATAGTSGVAPMGASLYGVQ